MANKWAVIAALLLSGCNGRDPENGQEVAPPVRPPINEITVPFAVQEAMPKLANYVGKTIRKSELIHFFADAQRAFQLKPRELDLFLNELDRHLQIRCVGSQCLVTKL